jgi:beclin
MNSIYQLDASLVDLAPSAYDMIVTSLPPATPTQTRHASEAEKLAQLPTPASVKSAWQRSRNASASKTPTSSPSAKQPQSIAPLPNESFVILQDSVIHKVPSQTSPPFTPNKDSSAKSRVPPAKSTPFTSPTKQTEPDHPSPSPISHHLRSTLRLFNLLSSRTDIDHPLCAECAQILLTSLQRQLDDIKRERDGYIAFEKEVRKERERDGQGMSKEEAEKKIERLKVDERIAIEQLKEAEREKEQLDEEMRALELEEKSLELEEAELVCPSCYSPSFPTTPRFWRSHNDHLLTAAQQAAQLATLRAAYAADSATLEKLERTNVYNDAFCIGHDGVFGTINGLRMGRVPGILVCHRSIVGMTNWITNQHRLTGPR